MSSRGAGEGAAAGPPEELVTSMWWFTNCNPYLMELFKGTPFQAVIYGGFALNVYIGQTLNPGANVITSYLKGMDFTTIPANDVDVRIHSVPPESELSIAQYLLLFMGRDTPPSPDEAALLQSPAVSAWMRPSPYLPEGIPISSLVLNLPVTSAPPTVALMVGRIFPFLRNDNASNRTQHFQLQLAAVTPSGKLIPLSELTFTNNPSPDPRILVGFQSADALKKEFAALLENLKKAPSPDPDRIYRTSMRIAKIDEFLKRIRYKGRGGQRRSRSRRSRRSTT